MGFQHLADLKRINFLFQTGKYYIGNPHFWLWRCNPSFL